MMEAKIRGVLVMAALICVLGGTGCSSGDGKSDVPGRAYLVYDNETAQNLTDGGSCFGVGEDLQGETLTVTGPSGELLGSTYLDAGTVELDFDRADSRCWLPFEVSLPDEPVYVFEVDGFKPEKISKDYIDDRNGEVAFELVAV